MLAALVLTAAIPLPEVWADSLPEVTAGASVVMSGSTGEVIGGTHVDRKLAPSGTVKLMTAMIVIDRMHDESEYQNVLQITEDIASEGNVFQPMEKVSVEHLLYAMLMVNSHEAAETLAVYSAGSEDEFVEQMNAKAVMLGMSSTQYLTSTGKYRNTQFSTVTDTAKLMHAALQYPMIREILTTEQHTIPATNKSKERTLEKKNNVIFSGLTCSYCVTMKRPEAADNFIAVAERNGMEMIAVLYGAQSSREVTEARELLDYGYKNQTSEQICEAGELKGKVMVRHGEVARIPVYTATKGYAYVPPEGTADLIRTEVVLDKGLTAPIAAGTKAGELKIYVADREAGSVELIVHDAVAEGWFPSYIYISNRLAVFLGVAVVLLLIARIRIRMLRKKRRRRREERRKQRVQEIARQQKELEEDRRERNWEF
ncbi:MAG: D-alanyl-D-alanine carboxypeptidase [Mogibacterium sp.]|nr:D-alanyl-D-alanine carboxypeptidase [Mogibacterium sp.]